jgi:periplasmic divalent cation tolerance protein
MTTGFAKSFAQFSTESLRFRSPPPRILDVGHTDAVVVLTTLATTDEAARFVKQLLERRLVACGTILPGTRSLYRWEDKLADETEVVVMLKTRSGAIHGLEKAYKELHPYKVPELLAVPVSGGLERYLGWINDETSLTIV